MQRSPSSQKFLNEMSVFGQFEVHFFNVKTFSRARVVVFGYNWKEKIFNENISSPFGLKKFFLSISPKSIDLDQFWQPGSKFKIYFLNVESNIRKTLERVS